jgi:nucleotide-binding universal stress UspA family protein
VTTVGLNKILIGCDDTAASRDAQRFGGLLARSTGAALVLANVYRDDRARALDLLDDAERSVPYGTRAEMCAVRSGSPAHGLHDLARAQDADLIVVGQRRNTRGQSTFVTGAPCAVAVAPNGFAADPDPGVRVVGVAFDGSSESRAAVTVACDIASRVGAAIQLIGVAQQPPRPTAGMSGAWVAADFDYRAALRAELESIADGLPSELRAQIVVASGEPAAALIDRAAPLSLLVMGSHGRGPLGRALLGSVSAAVLRNPSCPVLVVPPGVELRQAAA